MTYSKMLTKLGQKAVQGLSIPTHRQINGFGSATRLYARKLGTEVSPPLLPRAVNQSNKLAFIAGSAALTVTAITAGYYFDKDVQETIDTHIDDFMASYGNQVFLEGMAYEVFRDSVYMLRDAELLHYGISFEDNEKHAVFYRGMTLPTHMDQHDPEEVKQWQDDIVQSLSGRGFSPLLWLTRPSATRTEGFNIHPHDGNVARARAPDTPASWSAEVMAMTCDFDTVKSYSTLGATSQLYGPGCILLAAPQKIKYLSSTDVKARHEINVGHEFEVITPHIDSSDTLAILFVENGKISRVEINGDIINEKTSLDAYSIDINLVKNLREALPNASPDAQSALIYLITRLESQTNKIDLIEEFDSKFNHTVDELIDNTKKTIEACDAQIEQMPGIVGMGLRAIKRENPVLSREKVAEILLIPLTTEAPTDEQGNAPKKGGV